MMETESQYGYKGRDGTCKASGGSVDVTTYANVTKDSTSQLQAALGKGPVSVTIEADRSVFGNYSSGIITSSTCGTNLDHAVLAVGYGSNYFIVKNSWGTRWGEKGYVRIGFADGAGICGIQKHSLWPTTN